MTSATAPDSAPRVLLACSGLEHARRGFESFARECFENLRDDPRLDLQLVKGSGPTRDRERSVPSLKRDARVAAAAGRAWGRDPLCVEQAAFAASLLPYVLARRPDVIYLSEWYTGKVLAAVRRAARLNYAIVLSNGSMAPEGFRGFDRVHQHTAPALEYVLARGADPSRHILLPVAFDLPPAPALLDAQGREALRSRLGLPPERKIVISVAALNRYHKRHDYLITEIARLPEPRPYLLLVGQPEAETASLRALAHKLLGEDGHEFRSVPRPEVDQLLDASDVFALCSLAEGLPRALVEAAGRGLPCVAHDYSIARYALGEHGFLADLTRPGALAELLATQRDMSRDGEAARARHRHVYESFSWGTLRSQYVDMLVGAVGRAPFSNGAGV